MRTPHDPLEPDSVRLLMERIHANAGREVCAFVLRSEDEEMLLFVPNLAETRREFVLGPTSHQWATLTAEQHGMKVDLFVHSHPQTIQLSDPDRKAMRNLAIPWLVVVLQAGQLRGAVYTAPEDAPLSEWLSRRPV